MVGKMILKWTLVGLLLMGFGGDLRAVAQVATTTVQDVVYRADGTPAGGSVVVSWGAFTTANGTAVTAGTASATIAAGGVVTISLAPNAGSTPMGSYYTAVFHLNDGTTTREYWVVPATLAGGAPVKLAAIETQVLPVSVAMQTVSKQYVDEAIANAIVPLTSGSAYVAITGDTMTGPLVLPGDPVSALQAADKNYVDANVTSVASGLGQKVSTLPAGTQVVSQPTGTQLQTNLLNGEVYATPYLNISGNDGVANALASADCGSGCGVVVERTYPGTEQVLASELPQGTTVEDRRGGSRIETVVDPLSPFSGGAVEATSVQDVSVRSAAAMAVATGGDAISSYAMRLQHSALTGGANQYPSGYESVPYFKSTYGVLQMTGNYNTQGQHVQMGNQVYCFGVGDCLAGGQFIVSEGGYRDGGDEGTHPFDLVVEEDNQTFAGTCAGGCTTGSTTVLVAGTAGVGREGDGRFLIDKNAAKVISSGTLVGGSSSGIFATARFSGTSFPVSVFLQTATAAVSQLRNMAPGTVTLAIATTGVTSGFATSTAALPGTSGVACVADPGGLPDLETAMYSVVDATHVSLTLNKVHGVGAVIAVGGLCGYGIEETVDTVGTVRQVFAVVGSTSATSLYYAQGITGVIGQQGTTGAYLNDAMSVASIARTGNVVTLTVAGGLADDVNGLTMTVSGVADSSYNGTFAVTTTSGSTLTYANAGANSTSTGGTVSLVTGGYALYPMAEVLSVYDAATKTVDGTLTLAANTVAWASGDVVEEPHYPQQRVSADVEQVTQYVPRPIAFQAAGKYYGGVNGPGLRGWQVQNGEPLTDYLGAGGTHHLPDDAYEVNGAWHNDFEVDAGNDAIVLAHCNLHGCNRWDSAYNLFSLQAATGQDSENYAPQSSTVTWTLSGVQYGFSPSAFTAGTIDVGTLNATTITGGMSAATITSGVLSAARLPVFGASGSAHAVGAVPDPGATAGAVRFLREDGAWAAPASGSGGGGSPSGSAGGDLGGSYPNPTVTAVHATSGTLNGVAIGASAASTGVFASVALAGTGEQFLAFSENNVKCKFCDFYQATPMWQFGQGQGPAQTWFAATTGGAADDSIGLYVGASPDAGFDNAAVYVTSTGASVGSGESIGWTSTAGAGTANTLRSALTDTQLSRSAAGVVSVDTTAVGNGLGSVKASGYAEVLTTPASSSAACTAGQFTDDANFHYVCVSANVWKRVALSSF